MARTVVANAADRVDVALVPDAPTHEFSVDVVPPVRGARALRVERLWVPPRRRRAALPYLHVAIEGAAPVASAHGSSRAGAGTAALAWSSDDGWHHAVGGGYAPLPQGAVVDRVRLAVTKPNGTLLDASPAAQRCTVRTDGATATATVVAAAGAVPHEPGDVVVFARFPGDVDDGDAEWLLRPEGHAVVAATDGSVSFRAPPHARAPGVPLLVLNQTLQPCVVLSAV